MIKLNSAKIKQVSPDRLHTVTPQVTLEVLQIPINRALLICSYIRRITWPI